MPEQRGNTLDHKSRKHLRARSLISVGDLSFDEIAEILRMATVLEREDPVERGARLLKRRVALLFYESSTRTRTSFELAAKSLGSDTALISSKSSSIEKGESLKDTGITLLALGFECIILRHPASGAPYLLERATGLPVINAGDGMHEHPTQALLDLRTILHALKRESRSVDARLLDGVSITIAGDIFHSRVARSNALLLSLLGARVILCGPPQLLPESAAGLASGVVIERDFSRALSESQVVMMLRIQKERLAGLEIDLGEYVSRYQLTGERLRAEAPTAVVMHPGPIIRGMEITSEAADGPQAVIADQVANGVPIRMALIVRALKGESASKSRSGSPSRASKSAAKPRSVSRAREKRRAK